MKWSANIYHPVLMSVHLHSLSTRIFSLLGSSVRESTLFSLHQGRTLSRRVCLKRSLSSNEWHPWLWKAKIHSIMFIIKTCFVHIVLTHNGAKTLFETCSCFLIPFGRATHTNTSYMLHTARWIGLTRICFDPVRTCPLRPITYEHICGQPSTCISRCRVATSGQLQDFGSWCQSTPGSIYQALPVKLTREVSSSRLYGRMFTTEAVPWCKRVTHLDI